MNILLINQVSKFVLLYCLWSNVTVFSVAYQCVKIFEKLQFKSPYRISEILKFLFLCFSGLCKFILQIGHQLTLLTIDGEKLTDRSLLTITKNCSQLQTFQVSFASGFTSDAVVQLKVKYFCSNLNNFAFSVTCKRTLLISGILY